MRTTTCTMFALRFVRDMLQYLGSDCWRRCCTNSIMLAGELMKSTYSPSDLEMHTSLSVSTREILYQGFQRDDPCSSGPFLILPVDPSDQFHIPRLISRYLLALHLTRTVCTDMSPSTDASPSSSLLDLASVYIPSISSSTSLSSDDRSSPPDTPTSPSNSPVSAASGQLSPPSSASSLSNNRLSLTSEAGSRTSSSSAEHSWRGEE